MPSYDVVAAHADYLRSDDADYTTRRAGGAISRNTFGITELTCGDEAIACYVIGLEFDTSVIGDDEDVDSVVFHIALSSRSVGTAHTGEARLVDFGAGPIDVDDWVPGDDLDTMALLATTPIPAGSGGLGSTELTSEAGFAAAINKAGPTRLLLVSSFLTDGTYPGGNQFWRIIPPENSGSGGILRPRLEVVTVPAALAAVFVPSGVDAAARTGASAVGPVGALLDRASITVSSEAPGGQVGPIATEAEPAEVVVEAAVPGADPGPVAANLEAGVAVVDGADLAGTVGATTADLTPTRGTPMTSPSPAGVRPRCGSVTAPTASRRPGSSSTSTPP